MKAQNSTQNLQSNNHQPRKLQRPQSRNSPTNNDRNHRIPGQQINNSSFIKRHKRPNPSYTPFYQYNDLNFTKEMSYRQMMEKKTIYDVVTLKERLKNIHQYYNIHLKEQKNKSSQQSEIILSLIDQLNSTHSQKVSEIQGLIKESEQEKKNIRYVDEKMSEIQLNIDDLIEQSNRFKQDNQSMQQKIMRLKRSNMEKQKIVDQLNDELMEARNELEMFERSNLKYNKNKRQMLEIIKKTEAVDR